MKLWSFHDAKPRHYVCVGGEGCGAGRGIGRGVIAWGEGVVLEAGGRGRGVTILSLSSLT